MTTAHDAARPGAAAAPGGQATARAAGATAERHTSHLDVPILGRVELPPTDQLAFLGGVVTLAVVGIMEWPVAIVLTVGHVLAHNRHVQLLRDFGKALEEA
jgi:hypothetical protein